MTSALYSNENGAQRNQVTWSGSRKLGSSESGFTPRQSGPEPVCVHSSEDEERQQRASAPRLPTFVVLEPWALYKRARTERVQVPQVPTGAGTAPSPLQAERGSPAPRRGGPGGLTPPQPVRSWCSRFTHRAAMPWPILCPLLLCISWNP